MASPLILRGMTWNHARGLDPMLATARRFAELHPGIAVTWETRSLKDFEDFPIARLARDYDLIVLDHPSITHVAREGILLPLDEHLPAAFLADQAANSTGVSHASYHHLGHQWALAIDAAAPIAFWREDLLARHGLAVPSTWDELLALARRGHVEVPSVPINCLMNFFTFALAAGGRLFASAERLVESAAGLAALANLRELLALADPGGWDRDPIASHELVASADNDRLAYCPLAYGYSNYAREGFAAHRLLSGAPPPFKGAPLPTVLGGAGLAISVQCPHRREALAYAEFTASAEIQRTLYPQSGGQPGHRSAWLDAANNRLTRDYFKNTLAVLDRAWLRPRHAGYQHFQDAAAPIVQDALRGRLADRAALEQLDALHRETFTVPAAS